VKLEEIVADDYEEIDDGFSYTPKEDRKRRRQSQEEEEFFRNEGDRPKREKKKNKHNPEYSFCGEETSVDIWDSQKKHKKRKRKEEVSGRNRHTEGKEESSTDQSKKLKKTEREKQFSTKKKKKKQTKAVEQTNKSFSLNPDKKNTKTPKTQPRKKRAGSSDSSSTSSDSDSSESDVKQNKSSHKPVVATHPKDKSQAAANSDVKTVVSSKVAVKSNAENSTKTAINKNAKKSQSSSSDSDSSTEDEKVAAAPDSTAKRKSLPGSVAALKTSTPRVPKAKTSSSESDSSDSETLVIKKPTASAGLSNSIARNCMKQLPTSQGPLASSGRGRGCGTGENNFWRGPRGRGFRGMMRGQGRGRGANPGFFYNYSSEGQKQRQLNEAATNSSVLVQNPVEVPKRDYSVLPLLAAPPQVGERIAFKRLELTENYSPEVSDYKEGKIISWNADKKQIELEILSSPAAQFAKEPGKFDLVYQSADGAELIEYAVPQDTKITESWDALIEPRLIVEPPVNGSSTVNGAV
ncbi:PREDICTED: coilin, partial [Merops nubicus]